MIARAPHKGKHAAFGVRTINPEEPIQVVVAAPDGRLVLIELIQILHEPLQSAMVGTLVQKPPINRAIGIPLRALANFTTHEKQFLSGEKPLISQKRAQIRELPPIISRHSSKERPFSMHYLVMGKRQNEILIVMVQHREGEIILMVFSINRVAGQVLQRVMHPAHVPLEREA